MPARKAKFSSAALASDRFKQPQVDSRRAGPRAFVAADAAAGQVEGPRDVPGEVALERGRGADRHAAGSCRRCTAGSSTSGRPAGRRSTSRSGPVRPSSRPAARRASSSERPRSRRSGARPATARLVGRPPGRSPRRPAAACGRRRPRISAARLADAVAGHADHDDLRAVDLRFFLQHDQGPLVAALDARSPACPARGSPCARDTSSGWRSTGRSRPVDRRLPAG